MTGLSELVVSFSLKKLIEGGFVERTTMGGVGVYSLTQRGLESPVAATDEHEPSSPTIKEGTILGDKYVLEKLLGEGTYGQVWKATDKSLERTVAVKLLHGGMDKFKQLKTEGKALSALTHKNIVVVHALDSDGKNGWLVMEMVDGPSLEKYLNDKAKERTWVAFKEARTIVEQCLEALEFAHDKNRVHGDIKPGNIFLPKTGEVKLGDFGVAKILSGSPEKQQAYPVGYERQLGSSTYAAPEVLKGQPRDFQSDLFSIGILAYLLLTGKHPYLHGSGLIPVSDIIENDAYVPQSPCDLNKEIPEKYGRIVTRLLERDKAKRYAKAREVLDDWREKAPMTQCSRCNTENPITSKYCSECGSNLVPSEVVGSKKEADLNSSIALSRNGHVEEAIDVIKKSLAKNTKFAKGWAHLGFLLNFKRMYEEADDACSKSINSDPELSQSYQTRGFARSNLGRYEDAVKDFTEAFNRETNPRRRSIILYQRGYSRKLAGDFQEALEDAKAALELDSTNVKATRLKDSLGSLGTGGK